MVFNKLLISATVFATLIAFTIVFELVEFEVEVQLDKTAIIDNAKTIFFIILFRYLLTMIASPL